MKRGPVKRKEQEERPPLPQEGLSAPPYLKAHALIESSDRYETAALKQNAPHLY